MPQTIYTVGCQDPHHGTRSAMAGWATVLYTITVPDGQSLTAQQQASVTSGNGYCDACKAGCAACKRGRIP